MTDELRDLCSAAVDGTLTPDQSRRLEEIVSADPAARRFLVEHLNLHATLAWAVGDASILASGGRQPPVPGGAREQGADAPRSPRRNTFKWAGWAVAACLLVGFGVAAAVRPGAPRGFASLADAKGCLWESGTLPTAEGSRLGAGRLRLAEGVARIVFDNGAELRIEGPAELELATGTEVSLHSGRLVARCPDSAHGFVVNTPTAGLTDHGTEFGVNVGDGKTDVQVFEGRVDVRHAGRTEELVTGRGMRFTPDTATAFDPRAEGPQGADPPPPLAPGQRLVTITTATGRGRDAYVIPKPHPINRSDVLILVKSCVPRSADYFRKGYVGFDLAQLAGARVVGAQLSFTQTPTGMGFASEVPDSTFSVYGVTDESLDGWSEARLAWDTAPANRPGGAEIDPRKAVKVGEFRMPQGVQTGVWSVSGPSLAEFLNRDTNGVVTFVLVRDTPGSGRNDYVHGFAGKEHPTLPPPTLKVVVEGK